MSRGGGECGLRGGDRGLSYPLRLGEESLSRFAGGGERRGNEGESSRARFMGGLKGRLP